MSGSVKGMGPIIEGIRRKYSVETLPSEGPLTVGGPRSLIFSPTTFTFHVILAKSSDLCKAKVS